MSEHDLEVCFTSVDTEIILRRGSSEATASWKGVNESLKYQGLLIYVFHLGKHKTDELQIDSSQLNPSMSIISNMTKNAEFRLSLLLVN